MTDEQLRIRGYLQAQGAKLPPPDLVERVRAAMGQVREAVTAVPAARFTERPATDEWSANEVMAHVVTAGSHFAERIVGALNWREALLFLRLHDLDHAGQLQKIAAALSRTARR